MPKGNVFDISGEVVDLFFLGVLVFNLMLAVNNPVGSIGGVFLACFVSSFGCLLFDALGRLK